MSYTTLWKKLSPSQLNIAIQTFSLISIFFEGTINIFLAAELVSVFENIPTAYLCGISTPLIYHLAGIGTILGSVMESPLSETSYRQVRGMMLSIADLLARLERGLSRAADISKSLHSQVQQIDAYMRLQHRTALDNSHRESIATTIPMLSQDQGRRTGVGENIFLDETRNNENDARIPGTDGQSAVNGSLLLDQWMGDVQLLPELLDDWLWPYDLQPDSWSSLGL
jgi:hypothetical protein